MFPILDLAIVGLGLLASGLRVAQEYERGVVFKLGRHHGLHGPGLYWIIPLALERSITYRQRHVSSRSITDNNS
jgi:regulator of protease activity HflC (stomatin/prohibitin superfamily)